MRRKRTNIVYQFRVELSGIKPASIEMIKPELKVFHIHEAVGLSFHGLDVVLGTLDDCAGSNCQVSICRMSHKLSTHAGRKRNPGRNEISKFRRALEVVLRVDESGEDDETDFFEPVYGGDQSGI